MSINGTGISNLREKLQINLILGYITRPPGTDTKKSGDGTEVKSYILRYITKYLEKSS